MKRLLVLIFLCASATSAMAVELQAPPPVPFDPAAWQPGDPFDSSYLSTAPYDASSDPHYDVALDSWVFPDGRVLNEITASGHPGLAGSTGETDFVGVSGINPGTAFVPHDVNGTYCQTEIECILAAHR